MYITKKEEFFKTEWIKSWKDLKDNLVLFVPDLILIIFTVLIIPLLLYLFNLVPFLKELISVANSSSQLLALFKNNLVKLMIAFTTFLILIFFFGNSTMVMRLGMIKDIKNKKKASLKNVAKYIKDYYWKLISIRFLMYLLFLSIIILSTILMIIFGMITLANIKLLSIIFITISILISIALFLFLFLSLFYIYPIAFLENKNIIGTIKNSFNYFYKNKRIVIYSAIIVFLTTLIISSLFNALGNIPLVGIFFSIIGSLANLAISIWIDLFLFNTYKSK